MNAGRDAAWFKQVIKLWHTERERDSLKENRLGNRQSRLGLSSPDKSEKQKDIYGVKVETSGIPELKESRELGCECEHMKESHHQYELTLCELKTLSAASCITLSTSIACHATATDMLLTYLTTRSICSHKRRQCSTTTLNSFDFFSRTRCILDRWCG